MLGLEMENEMASSSREPSPNDQRQGGMVERVARALCSADGENPGAFHTRAAYAAADRNGFALTDAAIPLWMGYRRAARAAIAEMGEPTEAMCLAGEAVGEPHEPAGPEVTWTAMIQAALKETT